MHQTGRKLLFHDIPSWVDPAESEYFVTLCCKQRGKNQLCLPGIGEALLASAQFYREREKWFPILFLPMPDHVHMIVSFGREQRIETVVGAWKRHASTRHGIAWQRGFFEHRLRQHESAQEKFEYIRQNPVRVGLVNDPAQWPFVLAANG